MRILFLPANIASIPSHSIHALRRCGHEARGIVLRGNTSQHSGNLSVMLTDEPRGSLRWWLGRLRWVSVFVRAVAWADVIHWCFGRSTLPFYLDLALLKRWRKPGLVEWVGSDMRIPEVELADNPYFAGVYGRGYEYYAEESRTGSRERQRRFAAAGLLGATWEGMVQYAQFDCAPPPLFLPRRLNGGDYTPSFSDPQSRRPLIVHAPSAPVTKGTAAVMRAIEQLRPTHEFDFKLLHRMPRSEALGWMQAADLVLDQFVMGDYGMVALEAMAMGKPVVCYLKPSIVAAYADHPSPIVHATQASLPEILAELLRDGERRVALGRAGRAYIEARHALEHLMPYVLTLYTAAQSQRPASSAR